MSRDVLERINRWQNDPALVPPTRPCRSAAEAAVRIEQTMDDFSSDNLRARPLYLIHIGDEAVGECNFEKDPPQVLKHHPGTAWVGIVIGEASARGKGIGAEAMRLLESEIWRAGLRRIELGCFEFNVRAMAMYRRMGYHEFGRVPDFTWFDGGLRTDVRFEKFRPG